MQTKYEFGTHIRGVILQIREMVWPKENIPDQERFPCDDIRYPYVEIRTHNGEVVDFLLSDLRARTGALDNVKLKAGDHVAFSTRDQVFDIVDGKLSRVRKGSVPATDFAYLKETPKPSFVNPAKNPKSGDWRDKSDAEWETRRAQWEQSGGIIKQKWANCVDVVAPNGDLVRDFSDRIEIVKPTIPSMRLAASFAKTAWGSAKLQGDEQFLLDAYTIASNQGLIIKNYNSENAQRGLKASERILALA